MELLLTRSIIKPTHRHFLTTILLSKHPPSPLLLTKTTLPTLSFQNPKSKHSHFPLFTTPKHLHNPKHSHKLHSSHNSFARTIRTESEPNDTSFIWKFTTDNVENNRIGYVFDNKRVVVTVVILGWLGSQQKHLRRYADMYNVFGMNSVTFAVNAENVIGFDLGGNLERKVEGLCHEIVKWVEGKEDDGRERLLVFHTFSNTGWLGYGAILNVLEDRNDIREKIIGCVVDSGGAPELDPKLWAAGFATALLKKQSSSVNSSSERGDLENGAKNVNADAKEPMFMEVLLLKSFEMFFTFFLQIPYVKRRLTEITTTLSKNQPNHPQLYLYSTVDHVIPFQSIELFAENQKKLGKKVTTFNFKSSPHVDHFRTFTDTYQSLIQNFLKDCFAAKGKQLYDLVH